MFELSYRPILTGLLVVACLNGQIDAADGDTPTISVQATATSKVVPDVVSLRFGIESRAAKLADAAEANDKMISAVIEYLRESEVPERNIRTEALRINPIYPDQQQPQKMYQSKADPFNGPAELAQTSRPARDDQPQSIQPIGYNIERKLSITMNDLTRFEQIYRGLIERGVNEVDSISFDSSKVAEHRQQARLEAIRNAKAKAESLASELGAELAAVQTIREDDPGYSPSNAMMSPFGRSAESSGFSAGEIEIQASVQVVFTMRSTEYE